MLIRGCLVGLLTRGALLPASGCRHPNRPRQSDDLKIKVELTRSFVRRNMQDVPKDLDVARETVDKNLEAAEDIGDVLFCLLIIAPIAYGVEDAIEHADTAKGHIRPKGIDGYRQRLYWGENRVYLPRGCAGQVVTLVVEFRGNYEGTYEFEVDLARRHTKVKL